MAWWRQWIDVHQWVIHQTTDTTAGWETKSHWQQQQVGKSLDWLNTDVEKGMDVSTLRRLDGNSEWTGRKNQEFGAELPRMMKKLSCIYQRIEETR